MQKERENEMMGDKYSERKSQMEEEKWGRDQEFGSENKRKNRTRWMESNRWGRRKRRELEKVQGSRSEL